MKRTVLFFGLLFVVAAGFSQNKEARILWQESEQLTWENFKGAPNAKIPFHASTNSGIAFNWSLKSSVEGTEFLYEVKCSFHPDLSWVKDGKRSVHLLSHEQLHFDISEVYARKFRKALKEYEISDNIKEDLQNLYQDNEVARQKRQNDFDAETKHSQNQEAQKKWREQISAELEALKEFAL